MSVFVHSSTGTNGFIGSAVTIISTEINALGSSATVASTINFTQASFNSGQQGLICLTVTSCGWNVSAGGNITGWWLHSRDGGTTFEANVANTALPRPPDWVIPLPTVSPIATGDYYATGVPNIPWDTVRIYVQNNTGAAISPNSHTIKVLPVADTFV